ncbi:Methyltransferase-like protein 5, partial [Durusdinium trenchii]
MALNFWHGGLRSFPNEVLLTRHPSKAHRTVYRKLMNALAADGPDSGTFEVLACGRRFPQLVARLGEISDYVTKLGAAGPYSHFYHGHEVPLNNSVLPQLQPYMPLDANRLSVKGHGCFDATPHLGDELLMAYRMPDLILCDRQPQYGDFPIMTDDATQIIQLAKIWDARGLLFLRRGPVEAESLTRVFNNFKNEECDRQIGDRRGRNYQEAKVYGPSRHLPAGPDLTDLHLDGRKEALFIYCTDRSDFYHQFAVTDAKAAANAVGPPVTAADVADLHAYSEMLSREANEKKVKRTREVEGDQLHLLREPSDKKRQRPVKPIAFKFDFIEIYAGSARVSSAASSMGLVVGPPVDIAYSGELDLSLVRVIGWLSYMVTSGLLGSLMVEPVCTTFSIIRRPRLRSSSVPLGFDPRDPKTHLGNVLALRALTLLFLAHRYGVPALGEQPWSSMMRFLPSWRALEEKPGVRTMRSDSCAFGSIHLKSFRFIAVHLGIDRLNRRCSGDHSHIPVEGRYAKASASYTHELAHEIAACFAEAVAARKNVFQAEEAGPVDGLENQLVNLVATSSSWKARSAWSFQTERHINVLEMKSVVRLAERLIGVPRPLRVVNFVDSYVIRCAASKGRSSSIALSPFLRKFGALSVAGGLYFTLPFVPTRHNPADDPTRDHDLRQSLGNVDFSAMDEHDIRFLATSKGLRRWASNWLRLTLGLFGFHGLPFGKPGQRCHGLQWTSVAGLPEWLPHDSRLNFGVLDFDCTLGFPGEGPPSS